VKRLNVVAFVCIEAAMRDKKMTSAERERAREARDWHERAARGEVEPELIFGEGRIVLRSRFGIQVGALPYDASLSALRAHGKSLDKQSFLLGTPAKTHKVFKDTAPALPVADFRKDRRGDLKAFDPQGLEVLLRVGRGVYDIWRDDVPLCYGGYRGTFFEDWSLALAIVNEVALGRAIAGWHWEDQPAQLTATALRASALLQGDETQGRRMKSAKVKVREALGEAVAACLSIIVDKSPATIEEAGRRVEEMIDLSYDLTDAGEDWPGLAEEAQSEIVERFVCGGGMPRQHAEFFASVPLMWMFRAQWAALHGRRQLLEQLAIVGNVEKQRADAALDWLSE
jgi:hypothetical protein